MRGPPRRRLDRPRPGCGSESAATDPRGPQGDHVVLHVVRIVQQTAHSISASTARSDGSRRRPHAGLGPQVFQRSGTFVSRPPRAGRARRVEQRARVGHRRAGCFGASSFSGIAVWLPRTQHQSTSTSSRFALWIFASVTALGESDHHGRSIAHEVGQASGETIHAAIDQMTAGSRSRWAIDPGLRRAGRSARRCLAGAIAVAAVALLPVRLQRRRNLSGLPCELDHAARRRRRARHVVRVPRPR